MAESLMDISKARYLPSDIIAAILGLLGCENFTGKTEKIQTTIATLRKHHPILQEFAFSTNGVYPFSRELENSLSVLQCSRLLRMENPDFNVYVVKHTAKEYIRSNVLPRFKPDELLELHEIARKFEEVCGL